MASIYKRGKIWWVHYLVAGKSLSKSLRTTNERIALDKKKRLEALEITDQLMLQSNTPLDVFLQSFCEYLIHTRTHKSAKNDLSYLRTFFGPCCPALFLGSHVPHKFRKENQPVPLIKDKMRKQHIAVQKLEDITTEMVNHFIQDRMIQDGINPKTANRLREVLHKMFSYAMEHFHYICRDRRYRNPVEGVKRIREGAPIIRWLNEDDIPVQFTALEQYPEVATIVAVYIYAGLRREEALWLTHEDVDLKERIIRVRAKTIGKESWQPKTKRNRIVPISTDLYSILKNYRSPDGAWYFPSPTGKRWDPDNFSQNLREINTDHKLVWNCLDFRHTFGSHLAQKGESLYKIAELMGNSPEICRRHYAALIPEKMRDTVEFRKENEAGVQSDSKVEAMLEQILAKLSSPEKDSPARIKLVR